MLSDVVVEMMTGDFILWRCLHGGPLTRETVDRPPPQPGVPWERFRARNVPLLRKLTDVYGSCAVIARDGDRIVGQLRFYPRAVCAMTGAGRALCLQQEFPAGPADDLVENDFPLLDGLADRTLFVHCMMTGSPHRKENPYQHRGIGSRMVRTLMDWAGARGWRGVEAHAYADLPIVYAVTGQAGRAFWEKLGFRAIASCTEPAFAEDEHSGFVATLLKQAAERGIDADTAKTRHTMRRDLD